MIKLLKRSFICNRINKHKSVSILNVVISNGYKGFLARRVRDVKKNAVAFSSRHPFCVRIFDRWVVTFYENTLNKYTYFIF